jgi:hypothetical protein
MMLTTESWFVGVSRKRQPVSDDVATGVLLAAGCDDIEPMGSGTAQCRIPRSWLRDLERAGGLRRFQPFRGNTHTIDIDLP